VEKMLLRQTPFVEKVDELLELLELLESFKWIREIRDRCVVLID